MYIDRYINFDPLTVVPNTLLKDAVISISQSQSAKGSGCLLVVAGEKLLGILTQSDVVRLVATRTNFVTTVEEVMTQPVLTRLRTQCCDLDSVRSFFQQHSVGYLPLVNENQELVGVINSQTLIQLPSSKLSEKQTVDREGYLQEKAELEQFFDLTPSMVCVADFNGYFKKINPAFQKNLGFTETEILTQPFINLVHPEDRTATIAEVQKLTAGKTTISFENRYRTQDGHYRWLLWTAKPNLATQTIFCIGQDITEKKQAIAVLQESHQQFRLLAQKAPVGIFQTDALGNCLFVNLKWQKMTGLSEIEAAGRGWANALHPEDREDVFTYWNECTRSGREFAMEYRFQTPEKQDIWVSGSAVAYYGNDHEISGYLGTVTDITPLEFQYRQNKLLTEITDKIRMSIELDEVLQTTVDEVQNLLACDRVLIVEIRSNNTVFPIREAILPNLTSMEGYEIADPLLMGEYLARYHQGKVLAIDNLDNPSINPDIKQLLQQFQVQAKLVVPILTQGELKGLLIAHQCDKPRQWQEYEIHLLNQLADRLGVALSQAQLFNYAEKLVLKRTEELTTTNELLKSEIAERKQTEHDLRENQDKLAGILDNAGEAIISIDERQEIQLFNQGAEEIFGYQGGEVIGKPLDILLPKAFQRVHRHHVSLFGRGEQQSRKMAERSSKVFGRRKDGHEFPAEASVAKLQTKSGMLFTVMLNDISDRQKTQEKLQTSQALLAKAEKIAKIGSWEYDHEAKQRRWSEELFNILGFDQDYPIPSCPEILDRVHPEDLLLVKNNLRAGHRHGQSWEINYRLLLPDGTLKYIESRGEATLDAQGKVLKVLETIMDVSERIQAEKSLQRSEEQLRLITDALPVLIAYIDNRQRYRYNNRTYETWYGKPLSSLQGKAMGVVVGKDNYQKILPYIQTALAGQSVTFETQLMAENGSYYWMSATYIPDLDADGNVKGFFSMVDDITERKAVDQMKSEFISIASHEMRTPLTSIHGVIKLLAAGRLGELSERGKSMAEIALKNSDRLVHLVSDILDLERMESGRDEITKTNCDSVQLIQQAIDTVSSMAREEEIILETNSPSVEFQGDRDRLTQALTNLLSNAIKFSAANSKVGISSQLKGDNILFSVKDKGRGIPADKLDAIFERFQQVDASDSRKKGGTGLGLAICRHIVEQHGGKIWVESIYEQGSTFYFSLPR